MGAYHNEEQDNTYIRYNYLSSCCINESAEEREVYVNQAEGTGQRAQGTGLKTQDIKFQAIVALQPLLKVLFSVEVRCFLFSLGMIRGELH